MKSSTLIIFSLFWSAGVLFFDGLLASSLYDQWLSQGFAETTGKILTTKIEKEIHDKSVSYNGYGTYEYEFDGVRHESPEVGFVFLSSSTLSEAESKLKDFPRGTPIPVFVNPLKTSQAFLFKGFTGESWILGLFLAPFHAVMFFLWYATIASRRPPRPIGGAEVRNHSGKIKIRWATMPPSLLAMAAFGGVGFVGAFLIMLLRNDSSSTLPLSVCAVGLGAGIYTWLTLRRRNALTHPDLVLDPMSGTISLFKAFDYQKKKQKAPLSLSKSEGPAKQIRFEKVQSLGVIERITTDDEGSISRTLVVSFQYLDDQGEANDLDLNTWSSRDEADLFAVWLKQTLRLKDAPAPF